MYICIKTNAIIVFFLFLESVCFSQKVDSLSFFSPSPEFNTQRFRLAAGAIGATYTGFSIALYNTWYKNFDQSSFHLFNDWGEWNNIDKVGHIYSAHVQALLSYKAAKWTGINDSKAIWTGVLLGGIGQTTIEVLDGFSSKWGFSISDFGANAFGLGLFAGQQAIWKEQRITLKVSSYPKDYSHINISPVAGNGNPDIRDVVSSLYGDRWGERYLKDYNAQTIWASANVKSFFPSSNIPEWANVSIGYGSENLFGGFSNDRSDVSISNPRYKQFFLSPDIDLTRIKVKKPFWKTVLSVLNIFKLPMPTLEYNSTGRFVWHWLFL